MTNYQIKIVDEGKTVVIEIPDKGKMIAIPVEPKVSVIMTVESLIKALQVSIGQLTS